ncbi:MAG: sugar phosphate nucleotidyltransferase [Bacteroidetes bacterium]|nr:sugar phosphate nucleotidyltransferase [Bacteroidota bacterium]
MKPTLLILAAGIGSRYGSLKQIDPLGPSGETIIDYSIYDAIRAGFGKVVFVIKENIATEFKEVFSDKIKGKISLDYAYQEIDKVPDGVVWSKDRIKPWGTGHAVMMAADKIHEPFAVINADDFYGRSAYQVLSDFYRNNPWKENDFCMVGFEVGRSLSEHGTVSRGVCTADENSFLVDVTERTKIARNEKGIAYLDDEDKPVQIAEDTIVSMNFWGFTPSFFGHLQSGFLEFIKQNASDPKAEFYIPTVVNNLIQSRTAGVKILKSSDQWFGMTYREDREMVISKIRGLIETGNYPENLWK